MSLPNTMIISEIAEPAVNPVEANPFVVEFFVVQGPGYRCTAYRDAAGNWHEAFSNEELFGDIQIVE